MGIIDLSVDLSVRLSVGLSVCNDLLPGSKFSLHSIRLRQQHAKLFITLLEFFFTYPVSTPSYTNIMLSYFPRSDRTAVLLHPPIKVRMAESMIVCLFVRKKGFRDSNFKPISSTCS